MSWGFDVLNGKLQRENYMKMIDGKLETWH